jgi:hypothetical protein
MIDENIPFAQKATEGGPKYYSDWLKKPELAQHFRISIRHVTNLTKKHVFPFHKFGKTIRYRLSECEKAANKFKVNSILE